MGGLTVWYPLHPFPICQEEYLLAGIFEYDPIISLDILAVTPVPLPVPLGGCRNVLEGERSGSGTLEVVVMGEENRARHAVCVDGRHEDRAPRPRLMASPSISSTLSGSNPGKAWLGSAMFHRHWWSGQGLRSIQQGHNP